MGSVITASGKRRSAVNRNSNIEFLRLLGMACIVLNHFPWDYDSLSSACFPGAKRCSTTWGVPAKKLSNHSSKDFIDSRVYNSVG